MDEQLPQDVAQVRQRFEEACDLVRPDLHRFCARMTGNPCDGEDVLQEALIVAFYRFPELRDPRAFRAWIFRIVHNKCIDFLRRRRPVDSLAEEDELDRGRPLHDVLDDGRRIERALATLIVDVAPRERACIVLKDILDWSLEETAEVTGATVGAVKAALHRGRSKLEEAEAAGRYRASVLEPHARALLARYVSAFNRRDWDAVLALLADDTQLHVVHRSEGLLRDTGYFENYSRLAWRWKLSLASVDGVESIVLFRDAGGTWVAHSIVQLHLRGDRIAAIRDYFHVDYLLRHCLVTDGAATGESLTPPGC